MVLELLCRQAGYHVAAQCQQQVALKRLGRVGTAEGCGECGDEGTQYCHSHSVGTQTNEEGQHTALDKCKWNVQLLQQSELSGGHGALMSRV